VWRTHLGGESLLYASADPTGIDPVGDVAKGLVAALVVVILSRWLTLRTRAGAALAEALAGALGPLTPAQVLVLAAASGIGEELFFRGALQPAVGFVVSSLVFGLVHIGPIRTFWPWTLWALVMGFVFGGMYALTGEILAPLIAHFVINYENLHFIDNYDPERVERHSLGPRLAPPPERKPEAP
jgi:membrane protease YdiL (CAAX protease family)